MTLADAVKQLEHDLQRYRWFVAAQAVVYDPHKHGRAANAIMITVTEIPKALPANLASRITKSHKGNQEVYLLRGRRVFWMLRRAQPRDETLQEMMQRWERLLPELTLMQPRRVPGVSCEALEGVQPLQGTFAGET